MLSTAHGLSARELYLELLAAALTGSLAAENWSLAVPPRTRVGGAAWRLVDAAARKRGLAIVRRTRPRERELGTDWPLSGETMVGRERLGSLRSCLENVLDDRVPGDLLEAGVWRGGAAIFMKGVLAANGDHERVVWLADSFAGLPRPHPAYPADRGDALWAARDLAVTVDHVRANFERYGLLDERVRFLRGWFDETLATAPVERLALLRIDADLYASTSVALRALYPRVAAGGYVVIDDYGVLPACRAAVVDFRRDAGVREPLEPAGHSAVLWRRAA